MSNQGQLTGAEVITFPPRVASTTPDADIASMIEVLQDQLALAREGKLRSVAGSCPSMRWKFGVELERPSVRRPEVELL